MPQTTITPKFEPGAGGGLSPGGVGTGPAPGTTVREVRDAQNALRATVTIAPWGIEGIVIEDACPAALKNLLLTIARRGVLYQVDPDAAPVGYAREPLTAWNASRLDAAVAAYNAEAAAQAEADAWPVGSVLMAVVSTNPLTLLGYGTWESIAPPLGFIPGTFIWRRVA